MDDYLISGLPWIQKLGSELIRQQEGFIDQNESRFQHLSR